MADISAAMAEFTRRAGAGGLQMQKCAACGGVAWPPRDACAACWSQALQWSEISASGVVIAMTTLHMSMEEYFRARLPWRVGIIRLDAGPVVYAHLHRALNEGDAARVEAHVDYKGRGVLVAAPLIGGELDSNLVDLISKTEE